ncbi:Rpn family recombination-promoting nuclease/putative transposase [Paenibacillus agri]|uniref:Rpn family recombination-promoting nuclease/putative transposase n=1 Tax=Paenibacillus agri TaxID=2744309 RepID=A0A850EMS5_9BACL|nr:Rpn family recombination-promoting nuclease/putative transposase [Paenibacillus agri]NUU62418.1 Rpn family recombination-promoting nuclease/putative transposase [Paenibacillus agri]
MMELLDPRVDFVFKRIFASNNNKDVLLAFLNRIFAEAGEPALDEVVLLNPYTDKDDPLDKQSIFDIWAKTVDGRMIDIEMQLFNKYDIEKRTLYYWSKRYSGQLQESGKYRDLKKCVTINILNYSLLPGEQYHSVFHLREDNSGIALTQDIEIHFLELPNLKLSSPPEQEGLVNWLLFLKGIDQSHWEVLSMNEPVMKKAMDTLQFLSQDSEARRIYEARQKYLHDEASLRDAAENGWERGLQKGMQEGLKEGLHEGQLKAKLEIAKKLLAMGLNRAEIREATGLSDEEIESSNP